MGNSEFLDLVDRRDFRDLFVDRLGWSNPDQRDFEVATESGTYRLTQVAGFKGLRVWFHDGMPSRSEQRLIDQTIGAKNLERLVIFADEQSQAWRWPRRAQMGGANAKLVLHERRIGDSDARLVRQLQAITIGFDEELTLVDLLSRMRGAFDHEAETTAAQAARLMNMLYAELETSGWNQHNSTLLLARLLFLYFADDSGMWKHPVRPDQFQAFLVDNTTADTLADDLSALFEALSQERRRPGLPEVVQEFRYVNGGLFTDEFTMGPLTHAFRTELIDAGDFDWSVISPAIFGSMFQTVKDKKSRRHGGEHYTTEESILRTIEPLFLTEFRQRLESSRNDRGQLTKLHNDLGRVRVLDPACGCGNFLIVAYRELRALELDLLLRQRQLDLQDKGKDFAQLSFDVTGHLKVRLDHFYGIEIEEWPARIAETAMLLVDHLANQRMEQDFGYAPDRLPIRIAPTILKGNALRADWRKLVEPTPDVIIVGNPPFIGQYTKTAEQTADVRRIWGARYNGYLDYVTCWYALAAEYFGDLAGRWAFVSTNSISQGEAAEHLWRPILEAGWRCRFAHRSFQWVTEAPDGAAVHVSIIGYDKRTVPKAVLWTYPEGGRGEGTPADVPNINPYLLPASNVFVSSSTRPVVPWLPAVTKGSQPTDDGNFFVEASQLARVRADGVAAKYLRQFVGARELLHDIERWCIWLEAIDDAEIAASEFLTERVAAVREFRLNSKKAATRAKAATPHLFDERRQPRTSYLGIPRHVGQTREFFTAKRLPPEVICGDANFMVEDADGFALGVLSSSMFILWMRGVGGRIKSDLRFSNTFVYNSFPLPPVSEQRRRALVKAAAQLVAARGRYSNESLADLYEIGRIPEPVRQAHAAIDAVIDAVFGVQPESTTEARQRLMLRRYSKLTQQDPPEGALFDFDDFVSP
ncbi:DNA methyltransferase [Herbiconiux sp.]|uniref:DNA methyltransferase n=1 Tax=Herbiconiux sp. TaxID=1871186 RepID=UPI0025B9F501|nr:DNA methyltransferase [Herbiconiux sp.]